MTKTEKLIARCKELGINTESLTNNAQREAAIVAAEGSTTAAATVTTEETEATAEVSAVEKTESPTYRDDRDRTWKFKNSAPKTINIDGHPMSQEEIVASEDVISELVYGNSSFLTQTQE